MSYEAMGAIINWLIVTNVIGWYIAGRLYAERRHNKRGK